MLNFPILDVAISLVLVYVLLSLACSAATEWVSKQLSLRMTTLEDGVRSLLNDPEGNGIASLFYGHPLITSLVPANRPPQPREKILHRLFEWIRGRVLRNPVQPMPAYIPARNFSLVLMNLIAGDHINGVTTFDQLRSAIADTSEKNLLGTNSGLRKALLALVDDAQGDLTKARQNIEQWFDDAMSRVSGWYKRDVQKFTFIFALIITLALNADTLVIINTFWHDDATRAAAVAYAEQVVKSSGATAVPQLEALPQPTARVAVPTLAATTQAAANGAALPVSAVAPTPTIAPISDAFQPVADVQQKMQTIGLPLGWSTDVDRLSNTGTLRAVIGLLPWLIAKVIGLSLTTIAVSMGAPFWFDILNKLVNMRSTGKPPATAAEARRNAAPEPSSSPSSTP